MTLLIKNAVIVGEGKQRLERTDVFISGNKISAIGNFPSKGADEVIDAQGGELTAGFIDIDTTSDHYLTLFQEPLQEDFLLQGVTTIIGGHCGASLAPLLYGSLESVREWAGEGEANVDWKTTGELLDRIDRQKLGVNFGTFAGHMTIRRALIGDEHRELTVNETKVFERVLHDAMEEGAFGLSFGLESIYGRDAPYAELRALGRVVKRSRGVVSLHLRSSVHGLEGSLDEGFALSRDTHVPLLLVHFVPPREAAEEYRRALTKFKEAERLPVRAAIHPHNTSIIPIYRLLPLWAQMGNVEIMTAEIQDTGVFDRIIAALPEIVPDDIRVVRSAPQSLRGYSLKEFMDAYDVHDAKRGLLELMKVTNMRAVVEYRNLDSGLLGEAMRLQNSFIANHAPSVGSGMTPSSLSYRPRPRREGAFSDFLRFSQGPGAISREDAVRRITKDPAEFLGIEKRGRVRSGYYADLVVMKEGAVRHVVVGGRVAVRDGALTGVRAGAAIRHL